MTMVSYNNANFSPRPIEKAEKNAGGHIGDLPPKSLIRALSFISFKESPRLDRVCGGFRDLSVHAKLDAKKIIEKKLGISLDDPSLGEHLRNADPRMFFYPSKEPQHPAVVCRKLIFEHLPKSGIPGRGATYSDEFKKLSSHEKKLLLDFFFHGDTCLDLRPPADKKTVRWRMRSFPIECRILFFMLTELAILGPGKKATKTEWQESLAGLEHAERVKVLTIQLQKNIDHLPKNMSVLAELRKLCLTSNDFYTIESLSQLSALKKLEHLELRKVVGISFDSDSRSGLSSVQQLQSLLIEFGPYCVTSKLPVGLSRMPNLKKLTIVGPDLPYTLGPLIYIETLELNVKKFATSRSIKSTESFDFSVMHKLATLIVREQPHILAWTSGGDIAPVVASAPLPNLREVQLFGDSLPIANLEFLKEAINLEKLKIHDNEMQDLPDFIGELKQLKELDLSGCSKLKALSPGMQHLIQLEHLNLSGCTEFFKEKEDYLLEFVPQIKRLTLNNLCFLEFPRSVIMLAENKNLQYLNLQDSVSADQIPDVLLRSGINICSSPDAPQQMTKLQMTTLISLGKGRRPDIADEETEEQQRPSKRTADNFRDLHSPALAAGGVCDFRAVKHPQGYFELIGDILKAHSDRTPAPSELSNDMALRFTLVPISKDGHCAFSAFRQGILHLQSVDQANSTPSITELRKTATQLVQQNFNSLTQGLRIDASVYLGENYADSTATNAWGGANELGALAQHMLIDLSIYDPSGQLLYRHNPEDAGNLFAGKIHLLLADNHYSLLIPRDSDTHR